MILRIKIDVPDDKPHADQVWLVMTALGQFTRGMMSLGYVPSGPSPLTSNGEDVGRFWTNAGAAGAGYGEFSQ